MAITPNNTGRINDCQIFCILLKQIYIQLNRHVCLLMSEWQTDFRTHPLDGRSWHAQGEIRDLKIYLYPQLAWPFHWEEDVVWRLALDCPVSVRRDSATKHTHRGKRQEKQKWHLPWKPVTNSKYNIPYATSQSLHYFQQELSLKITHISRFSLPKNLHMRVFQPQKFLDKNNFTQNFWQHP